MLCGPSFFHLSQPPPLLPPLILLVLRSLALTHWSFLWSPSGVNWSGRVNAWEWETLLLSFSKKPHYLNKRKWYFAFFWLFFFRVSENGPREKKCELQDHEAHRTVLPRKEDRNTALFFESLVQRYRFSTWMP